MSERWWSVIGIGLVLALGLFGRWIERPAAPAKRDPAKAERWMADALPAVGAKRIEAVLESLHAGRFDELPKQARETARTVFNAP